MNVTSTGAVPRLPIPETNTLTSDPSSFFNDHPFTFFWANGWLMRTLGPAAWSARLLTGAFSVGCIFLTLVLGTQLYSRIFGFTAAVFLLFTRDIILTGATVSLDPAMMFFILLSFVLWLQEWWLGVGIAVGIGLWIKTPVVLLVFPTAFCVSFIQGNLQKEFSKIVRSALLALLIGSVVWLTTGWLGGWQLVQDYWIRQVWGTAVGGRSHSVPASIDPWTFFRMIRSGFLPGLPFLILGIAQIIRKKLWKNPVVIASGMAIGVIVFAITPLKFRMDYYYNPVFPFLALLSTFSVIDLLNRIERGFYAAFASTACVLMAFLLCTPTPLGPEAFVALKRFMPFIQTYGSCKDEILLVPGGEPLGSSLDYGLVLNFYTGHVVEVEDCSAADAAIRKKHPKWVILSQDHLNQCISVEERSKFGTQIKVGGQYLLTDLIPRASSPLTFDLTPLERELKPSVDCKPPVLPKDIYHAGF